MPSSYTPSLRLTLPVTGENPGTWGDLVNTGITALVDSAVAGYAAITMTDADYTLVTVNGAADESRKMLLNISGTLTLARNVICPTASKLYFVKNATTGGFAITLKTSGGSGISIPNGKSMVLMCDGTSVVEAVNYSPTAVTSVTGTAPVVSSGGLTPAISMPAATASVNGYMTSTFATKLNGIGAGATVTGVTGTAPVVSSGGAAPVISMAAATASVNGYMTSTFAAKLNGITAGAAVAAVTGTAPVVSSGGTSPAISMAAATASVNGYMTSVYAAKLDGIGASLVTAVTGTAPVASSGGTSPAISMAAATASVDGYMTSVYAAKLDGITAGAAPGAVNFGYLNIPQNSQSAAYTLVLADAGKHIFHPSADTTARTYTIPANGVVAYPIGTAITFVNQNNAGTLTIAINSDVMRLAGLGTLGSRTLTANGTATALKVTATEWLISGVNLT